MTIHEARTFVARFSQGKYSQEEHESFLEWVRVASLDHIQSIAEAYESYHEQWMLTGKPPVQWVEQLESKLERLETTTPVVPIRRARSIGAKLVAAAAILLIVGSGTWYFFFRSSLQKETAIVKNDQVTDHKPSPIVPGGNKAVLKLGDGTEIDLNKVNNGAISLQGNTSIQKMGGNHLVYQPSQTDPAQAPLYNTVTTPRGGQYQLTLPDQTKIWLNAESSIRFPVAFTGQERKVVITGEVYFEVTENQSMPFKAVIASDLNHNDGGRGRGEVEVVGTHFNIMAYNNEPSIQTTLLKGSVKVAKGSVTKLLKPGQQAAISNTATGTDNIKVVSTPNADELVAWKDGTFTIGEVGSIMNQVARWYDVEVTYAGKVPDVPLEGKLRRDLSIEDLLAVLNTNGIHAELIENERKILVKE